MIEKLFLNIIEVTITSSFLIIPLLVISPLIKMKYTAKYQYLIWMIIGLRLLIPINMTLPKALFTIPVPLTIETTVYNENETLNDNLSKDKHQLASDSTTEATKDNESTSLTTPHNTITPNTNIETSTDYSLNITPLKIASIIWLVGVVVFLIFQFIGYFNFKKTLLRWSIPLRSENTLKVLKVTCNDLKLTKPIKIMKCKKILSPMAIGLFHPIVLLPELKIPLDELSIILKHELIHIKRHDISYKLLLTIAHSLHWFNPTVYFMVKEANKDLEFYCDEMVIKNMNFEYKTKYSEAILSVMHSKTNYNSILSTNFNGGVDTMKKRFINIFDNRKKRVGILSLTFIFALVLCGSSLVACQSSPKASSAEEAAKGFLKGYYEVDNILLLKDIEALWDEEMSKAAPPEGGLGITTMPEEGAKRYSDSVLKNVKSYIDEDFGETLIANRAIERKLQSASEYGYTLQVTNIHLTVTDDKTQGKLLYDYSLEVKLTYHQDGISKTQTIDGSLYLTKANDSWLVKGFTEKTWVAPDKKYYTPPEVLLPPDSNALSSIYIEPFSTSQELCDAYIQAMVASNFTFMGTHTANALKSTTLEEGQKLWDTIKIDSIEVITSEERANTKFPNLSKAYYEVVINVADPGSSDFKKGENICWLYLFSGKKGDTTHWSVETLNKTSKPDEQWWDTVNGG